MRNSLIAFAFVIVSVIGLLIVAYLVRHNYLLGGSVTLVAMVAGAFLVWVGLHQPKPKHWAGDWPHKTEQDEMNDLLKGF